MNKFQFIAVVFFLFGSLLSSTKLLAQQEEFAPPRLDVVESAASYGIGLSRGRVFVDLWDLRDASTACPDCHALRVERLHEMNLRQCILAPVGCESCGGRN